MAITFPFIGSSFASDSSSSSKSSSLERQRGSTDPTFVRPHGSKSREGLFQRRWNSLPHKKLKERLGSGKSVGAVKKVTGGGDDGGCEFEDDGEDEIQYPKPQKPTLISSKSAIFESRKTVDVSPTMTKMQPSLHPDSTFQAVVELPSPLEPPSSTKKDSGATIEECPSPGFVSKPRSNSSSDAGGEINVLGNESLLPGPVIACLRHSTPRFSVDVLSVSSPSPGSNVAASLNGSPVLVNLESGGRGRAYSEESAVTTTG